MGGDGKVRVSDNYQHCDTSCSCQHHQDEKGKKGKKGKKGGDGEGKKGKKGSKGSDGPKAAKEYFLTPQSQSLDLTAPAGKS